MKPTFFRSAVAFRAWLKKHHRTTDELWVGFYKKSSLRPSITWQESVDEALCYGWIDGLRRRVDEESYQIRFTPRRKTSVWSAVNIERVEALISEGRMTEAGLEAYRNRKENRSGIYSYEQRGAELDEPYKTILKKNRRAWTFLQAQPPFYRKAVCWWIVSAKKEETRLKRLEQLAEYSARHERIPQMLPKRSGQA